MNQTPLYPLRFETIYQYRLWGGRRLANWLSAPLPGENPIGEAWVLSDRDDFPSVVADGPLKGQTIKQLIENSSDQLLGRFAGKFDRFPLLLKFLDAREVLSVQVHPSDRQTAFIPEGERGKTEAWVVLESGPKNRVFAGLKPGVTEHSLSHSLTNGTASDNLASFSPNVGDGIFLEAGTVHTFEDLVVFEVQENSNMTFRLYDWDRVDAHTGKPRDLQIEQAMACIDFKRGPVSAVIPVIETETPVRQERLFRCDHFELWRLVGDSPFIVGVDDTPRIVVCLDGEADLEHEGAKFPVHKGDVILLPAVVGSCFCQPKGKCSLLEIAIPENT